MPEAGPTVPDLAFDKLFRLELFIYYIIRPSEGLIHIFYSAIKSFYGSPARPPYPRWRSLWMLEGRKPAWNSLLRLKPDLP